MKKNLRVNLSGLIFNIDEDAYEALQSYLNRLRTHFSEDENAGEIISDIEARIAEMFLEKTGSKDSVVTKEVVLVVTKTMGEPKEIDDTEKDEKDGNYKSKKTYTYHNANSKHRLYRDPDNKVVGGVASGLAAYFNIDRIWVRLAFIALTFFGMSILVYLILWIVIPEAKTTAQRLEMKGEAINIENIEKAIREEFNNLSDRFNDIKEKHFAKKRGELTIFEKFAYALLSISVGFFKLIGVFVGIVLAFVAFILAITITPIFFSNSLWINESQNLHFSSIEGVLDIFMHNPSDINLTVIALAMTIFIPLIAIVYQGIKLIFGVRNRNTAVGIILLTFWISGIALLVYNGAKLGNTFDHKAEVEHFIELDDLENDTLYVDLANLDSLTYGFPTLNSQEGEFFFYNDSNWFFVNPEIETKLSKDKNFSIRINKISRGKNNLEAHKNANNITYKYNINGNNVDLSGLYYWPRETHFRAQRVEITIYIPKDKVLQFNANASDLFDYDNFFDDLRDVNEPSNYIYINEENDRILIQNKHNRIEIHDDDIDFD